MSIYFPTQLKGDLIMLFLRFSLLFLLTHGYCVATQAQTPAPAPAQDGALLILGGRAHLGDGTVIENSAIGFDRGKITLVADATTIRLDRGAYNSIFDASGKDVYPGFIAMNSILGLVEIEAVRSTRDNNEVGDLNPSVRSLIAYNTDSDLIPTVRSNGVLMAQVVPGGGLISGKSAAVQLDAWNWEDAAISEEDGLHLRWPSPTRWTGWQDGDPRQEANDTYKKSVESLRNFFQEAKSYIKTAKPTEKNLKLEAMRPVLEGRQNLYIHAAKVRQIKEAVHFAEEMGCKPIVVGAADAWLITDFLKEHQVSVILGATQSLPNRAEDAVTQPFETPRILHEAGILFCISDDGAWQQRNLPFQIGQAIGYGLPMEAAVSVATLNAAKILNLQNRVGSLEVGKDATLFISEGDVFDMRSSQVIAAFIQGRAISLDDKHKALFKRFQNKK